MTEYKLVECGEELHFLDRDMDKTHATLFYLCLNETRHVFENILLTKASPVI